MEIEMNDIITNENPFQITTPEGLTAKEAVSLFIDVFTDFPKIKDPGHVFLIGPRGIGKSMMFRYLQADCQCLTHDTDFSKLPFWGIYVPIKNESFVKTELKRLEEHASEIFNEHIMVIHICMKVFDSILNTNNAINAIDYSDFLSYYKNTFLSFFNSDSYDISFDKKSSVIDIISSIISYLGKLYRQASDYAKNLAFSSNLPEYNGPLFDYQDFLVPLISGLTNIIGFPKGTIYLLIDDAHFLSITQTRILNSWIATRTSRKISLKVSSQYNYKTYYTTTGATVDSPHDYSEIDMTTVYTSGSGKSKYIDRIREIVNKRLGLGSINIKADDFFPPDRDQEKQIKNIADEYNRKYDEGKGKGAKRTDDAIRYARPDFIKNLAGTRKASSTYSYASFNQLVNLSSGIVRYFLEPAHQMYATELSNHENNKILSISPNIQNDIIRRAANDALLYDMDKYKSEGDINAVPKEDIDKLINLVQGLGGLFRQILLSNKSERRVFSVALSNEISPEVERIFNIGINFGFFHRQTIGRKDRLSGGRTKLFVMNRRLAPNWNLDPSGFAGYLFVKNSVLEELINTPIKILRKIEQNGELMDIELKQFNLFADESMNSSMVVYGEDDE
jgi:hypothetical protein